MADNPLDGLPIIPGTDALTDAVMKAEAATMSYAKTFEELTKTSREFQKALEGGKKELAEFYNKSNLLAIEYNSLASGIIKTRQTLEKFNTATPAGQMLYLGQALTDTGKSLTNLRDKIYSLQAKIGTTFSTAVDTGAGALMNMATSLFEKGPALSFQDTIDAFNAYQQEFGTLLTAGAARQFAQSAKTFGTDINTFTKAQRSFLGAGGLVNQAKIQQSFVTQFRAAGLTANQALKFAATNADLVAVAGVKYADSLARAAANATKIGISLDKSSGFFDGIVDDFEGALEKSSELRAMGFEIDFNEIAKIAGTGTEEERQQGLVSLFQSNRQLLEDVQRNAFLRRAIEKDTGFSIGEAIRLAKGGEALPGETTKQEKAQDDMLSGFAKIIGPLATTIGILSGLVGLNSIATHLNTLALMKDSATSVLSLLKPAGGAMGAAGTVGGIGVGLGSMYGAYQMGKGSKSLMGAIGKGSLVGSLGFLAAAALLTIGTGGIGAPAAIAALAAGGLLGGGLGAAGYTAANDIKMGPSRGRGRVILGPEGAFKLNARDSVLAGTNLFAAADDTAARSPNRFSGYNPGTISSNDTILDRIFGDGATQAFPDTLIDIGKDSLLEGAAATGVKFATSATARQLFNEIPLIGDLLAGTLVGMEEYSKTGNLARSLYLGGGYAASSAMGGALGALQAGAMFAETGPGALVAAAVGDAVGGLAAGEAFLLQERAREKVVAKLMTPQKPPKPPMSPPSLRAQSETTNADMTNTLRVFTGKVDRLASAFENMKIEMDGNTVGRVSYGARSPLDRLSVVGG